jgi:hypothetical protein
MYYNTTSQWTWNTRVASFTIGDLQVGMRESTEAGGNNYKLKKNFPNPFSMTTTIRWSLPETANIKLMVLDMTGKIIRTLVDVQQEAGEHSVEFNATGLAPGIYFCRLVTAESIENLKLVLIK